MAPRWAERWRRLGVRLRRRRVVITLAVLAGLFVVYTLAGFFLVPRLIARYVPRYAEQLGRRAQIGEVRVNPLLFKVDVRQLRLQEADGRPLLGFDRLFIDFELMSSIFRAAWTFAEIRLEGPRVDAVIAADGRMNIAELLGALPKGEPAKQPTAPPRLLVQHAAVQDGVVSLTDLSGRAPQTAAVQPINVELHDITTLLRRLIPSEQAYRHNDPAVSDDTRGNATGHLSAILLGQTLQIPVEHGRLMLGTWQSVLFCEFDGPQTRHVYVQVMGV